MFLEQQPHDDGYEHGIGKKNRGCYTGIHVLIAEEQQQRRSAEDNAHQRERKQLTSAQTERLALNEHHTAHHQNGEGIAIEKHGVGRHAVGIERQGKQRVKTIARSSYTPERDTFDFDIHILKKSI